MSPILFLSARNGGVTSLPVLQPYPVSPRLRQKRKKHSNRYLYKI